ncbi:MAG TPA: HlyD family efflux transporter periplasmic adaptor subunit [Moraxellaceae bacterium]|nr:HlyD family efflux transporter periplasmic adaptor subunit [Moraxellaceae bacterium]
MRNSWAAVCLSALASLALSGCSRHDDTAHAQSAGPVSAAMARGKVDVEGGVLSLAVPRDGVFDRIRVRPGDRVHQGDILGELDLREATTGLHVAEAEKAHAEAELKALQVREPLVALEARRWRQAVAAGAAEQQKADDAQQDADRLEADIAIARSAIALAGHKVELARDEIELRRLRSPVDAEVVQVLVQPGSASPQERQPAFVLLPERPRIVRAEINESYIRRVHAGMTAQVVVEADPSMTPLKAHVVRMSPVLSPARMTEEQQIARSLECELQFDNDEKTHAQELRIGQNVLVNFHDEKQ